MTDFSLYRVDLDTARPNPNDNTKTLRGDAPRTAFTKYNDMLIALAGSTINVTNQEPANPVSFMRWYDTSVNPPLERIRNASNTGWFLATYPSSDSLKLTGGILTGTLYNTTSIGARSFIFAGDTGALAVSAMYGSQIGNTAAGVYYEAHRLPVSQTPGGWDGCFSWQTVNGLNSNVYKEGYKLRLVAMDSQTNAFSNLLFTVSGLGNVEVANNIAVGGLVQSGNVGAPRHGLYRSIGMGGEICWFGRIGTANPCVAINASSGEGGWGAGGSVIYLGKDTNTNRSINAAGTVNASGADYAEYMTKAKGCGVIKPGQVAGINSKGELTDKWDDAISFIIKSTDPCMVGGDKWSNHLGQRPEEPAELGSEPITPVRYPDMKDPPNYSDKEWAGILKNHDEAIAKYRIAQSEHTSAVTNYRLELAEYEANVEECRKKVDRMAFAGQIPVNIMNTQPGQILVPIQDGDGIGVTAINEDDITLKQYIASLGKVITIEEDGRARIIVKVA